MAGKKRSGDISRSKPKRRTRAPVPYGEDSSSDDEEGAACTTHNKRPSVGTPPQMMQEVSTMAMTDSAGGGDGVSSIQGSMTGGPIDLETWRRMEERLRTMEERVKKSMVDGGVSVVSEATVIRPTDEKIIKENLRKFVTAKVFPGWKFIFKKEKLGMCIVSAVNKGYITVPAEFKVCELTDLYSPTVRACLDGCRANAQTCARTRYSGR